MPPYLLYILAALALVIVGVIVFLLTRKPSLDSLGLKLLAIELPRADNPPAGGKETRWEEEIARMEQLYSALASIGAPFIFEAAVHQVGEEIHFYLAVPGRHLDFATRQIEGLFPNARVSASADYNIFSPSSSAASAHLSLSQSYILPIRTYLEAKVDTFTPIISTLTKLTEVGEGAAIQLVVRGAKDFSKKFIQTAVERLKYGEKFSDIAKAAFISLKDVKGVFSAPKKKDEKEKPPIVDEEAVKALSAKISKPLFSVNIRLAAAAPTADRAEDILMSVASAYGQFSAPLRNSLAVIKEKRLQRFLYQLSFREFDASQAMVLNAEELASIFHLPTSGTVVPHIKWLAAKEAPPPPNLPSQGLVIGESVFRGQRRPVKILDDDRRRHLYLVGQTGTGKTTLINNLVAQDIRDGKGVCVIDPHGDLVNQILGTVPKERIDDCIVFNPGDLERPVGLNMLEFDPSRPEQKTFIVGEMQSIFNRLFSQETMGPMFEQYMRNTLLLLMEDMANEPATLVEVPRVFTDQGFRERKLARIKNPTVIDFWTKEASRVTGEASIANMSPYITSKFGNFIANDYIRPIIGQTKSAFNFRQIMDEGKILLVSLAKGRIGDINANLLGLVITGRILMAALSRTDMPEPSRRDFYFYIDEFQNFTTDSIATILSEARKYRLNLTLAHQFIAQLSDQIREAVFGNVGSMVAFRVGMPDTEKLEKQFAPEFSSQDLINLENRNAVLKMLINGQPTRAFNIRTLAPTQGSPEIAEKLKELSRLTFGRANAEIEAEIYQRLRS